MLHRVMLLSNKIPINEALSLSKASGDGLAMEWFSFFDAPPSESLLDEKVLAQT